MEYFKNCQEVHFLISDLEMPNLNGFELIRATREYWPELPSRILTGNHVSPLLSQVEMFPETRIALKPIDLMILMQIVRERVEID